jgi:hypothetical protein
MGRLLDARDRTARKSTVTHHSGVPSTNTTVEIEYGRLLPPTLQVHVARIPLLSSGAETTPRDGDADVVSQSRLLGNAKVEVVALAQTAASAPLHSILPSPYCGSTNIDADAAGIRSACFLRERRRSPFPFSDSH